MVLTLPSPSLPPSLPYSTGAVYEAVSQEALHPGSQGLDGSDAAQVSISTVL